LSAKSAVVADTSLSAAVLTASADNFSLKAVEAAEFVFNWVNSMSASYEYF